MPNWCYTNYVIEGREEEVAAFHKIITDLENRKESLLPNGFENCGWEILSTPSAVTGKRFTAVEGYLTTISRMDHLCFR